MRKTELPCGGLTIVSCDVLVEGQVDLEKMEIRGLENITDRVHVPLADRLFGHEQVRPVHYGSYNPVTMYNSYDDDEERTWGKHLMEGGV
jgi:hypothetical protein